jgi:hypothetical protein
MGRYGVDGEREGLGYWFAEVVDLLTRGLSKV